MLRHIPGLRELVRRRGLSRLAGEAESRSAAEHAAAVRRLITQAQAGR